MVPLESSALATTLTALARAFCVMSNSTAGSVVPTAASRRSTASPICRPCALDAPHRDRSARVRIIGRTTSGSLDTPPILHRRPGPPSLARARGNWHPGLLSGAPHPGINTPRQCLRAGVKPPFAVPRQFLNSHADEGIARGVDDNHHAAAGPIAVATR